MICASSESERAGSTGSRYALLPGVMLVLGGSGASVDAMAIWIAQFVDREIRVLDYIEGVGQVLAFYVRELRSRGWGEALCVLPHDGVAENSVTGKRYEDRP